MAHSRDNGDLIIVECKLWRNPDARRKVIGQILDYAKDLSNMNYSQLESGVLRVTGEDNSSIYDKMLKHFPDLDEAEFIDKVQRIC